MNAATTDSANSSALSAIKTLAVGLAAGLLATGVKTLCELISPPRSPGVPSPLGNAIDVVTNAVNGHPLPEAQMHIAEPTVHFLFGMGAGGVYALLVKKFPLVSAGYGTLYGFCFWLFAHEIVLPLLGLSPNAAQMTLWEQGNEFVSHLIFGAALEFFRRLGVRKLA